MEPVGVRRGLTTPRAAGVAGLVFSALFVLSMLLLRNRPPPGSSPDEIADWYANDEGRHLVLAGLYLAPFAGIAFLWFIAVLRDRIGESEDRFFGTVFLGSGLLFVAMVFAAAAAAGATEASVRFDDAPAPSADTVELARSLGYAFLFVYAARLAAVFMIVVSTIGLRTGALPRWLAVAGYIVAAVLLLSISYYEVVILLFPSWVAVASIVILREPSALQRTSRASATS